MKKITAKILLFVMIINAVCLNISFITFANTTISTKANELNFEWNKNAVLSDSLETVARAANSDEVLLVWDIDTVAGQDNTIGTHTLTYPIADNKEIEFQVKKENDKCKITYKVNGKNEVKNTSSNASEKLWIHKDGTYLLADQKTFPGDETFKLDGEMWGNGSPKYVAFQVGKNGGAAFKYNGNTIKFLYKDGKMYFSTNNVLKGNIYPFELKYENGGNTPTTVKKDIFLGIDTVNGFKVTPFANAQQNGTTGKDLIDQTNGATKDEYPGGDMVGVTITFNLPKQWEKAQPPGSTGSFKPLVPSTTTQPTTETVEVIFNLGHNDSSKKLQVKIPNIYKNNNVNINGNTSQNAIYRYDPNNNSGTLTLKNLEASTIYSDISISAERKKTVFETIPVVLPTGTIYTYPKYRVVALGTSEFYLEIEPYEGYNGFYVVYQGDQQYNLGKWSTYEEKNQGKENILVSVPLDALNPQVKFFKVDFNFTPPSLEDTNLPFTSQILKFKPSVEDIILSTPKNLKVVRSNIVRKDNDSENLYLTLKWDIDKDTVLKGLMAQDTSQNFNIDYLFYKGDKPENFEQKEFLDIKLKFASKDLSAEKYGITYELNNQTAGTGNKIEIIQEKTFTSERTDIIGSEKAKILEANVTLKIPVSSKDATNKEILQYPNTYFIANQGTYTITPKNGTAVEYKTGLSLPATLTLNGIENIEVAEPQNLKIVDNSTTTEGFSISYDTLKYEDEDDVLYNYNEIMLKNIGRELTKDSIKYDFYITQDKALFDEIVKYTKDTIPEELTDKIDVYSCTSEMTSSGIDLDFKTLQGNNGNLKDILRKKEIVKIENIKQNIDIDKQRINFKGLDENETYYVVGMTNVTPYEIKGQTPLFDKTKYSKFTNLVTATTKKDGNTPSENDKVPTAPNKFVAENVTLNSANLIWDKPKDTTPSVSSPKSTLEYQFIKTKGIALPDSFLKTKDSFEKTWEGLSNISSKDGLKTSVDKIYEFDKNTKQFSTTSADKSKYEYVSYNGEKGNILDKTLTPNQVYFYYVRTVRVEDGQDVAYSVWVPLTFTTKTTTGPKNLKVEPKAQYDKKTEVVISFDIPKMDTSLIGKEYDLQYSIKEGLGKWSQDITMPKENLTFTDNADGKTMKVTYKITGLKSGSSYTIRVKMYNKTLNDSSIYSNEVDHRTDSDNNDNDFDQDTQNWETNFKNLIEQLKNEPYWFGKDTVSNTLVYYRPQYFDKIISSGAGVIELAQGSGGTYKEYYLPASAVIKAFDQNKGFKISYKGADVIINAKTIDPYTNAVIKKIAEEIASNKATIKDYFIKITVDFKDIKVTVAGNDNLSPSANISINVVGTKTTIAEWDKQMYDYIDTLLKTTEFSTDVKKEIENLIKNKVENQAMLQSINKIVNNFKQKFGEEITKTLNNLNRKTEAIQSFTGDILYVYQIPTGFSASGYKKSDTGYVTADTRDYLGKKAIFTKQTGEYVFAGRKFAINGTGNLPNGDKINTIVLKYGLDDFLGKDGNINLNKPMTRREVIGSVARLAGATKTQDSIQYLKTKNITVSNRNMDNNITAEEAIYLVMKVYELRSGTKVETLKIKNYNLTKDIKNINSTYKKSIQVAFDIGIYNNSNMIAKGTISTQEFLQTLVNMSTMVAI